MSGYSQQGGELRAALVGAGLSADAASKIANILANSVQELRHSGPIVHDSTPANLRSVTPDDRTHTLQNLDFRAADADYRNPRIPQSEEAVVPQQTPNVLRTVAPQQATPEFRVGSGAFSDASGRGESVSVGVRSRIAMQPSSGLPIAMLDAPANTVVGKAPRAQAGNSEGYVRFDIRETDQEVLWTMQLQNLERYSVVTDIRYADGEGLRITYADITAWDERKAGRKVIPTFREPVIESITNAADGPNGEPQVTIKSATIPVFARSPLPDQVLAALGGGSLYVGSFTGGWPINTAKTITATAPAGEDAKSVMNVTQTIPTTPSTKYVLFGSVGTGESTAYYAVDIQPATECDAFSSLSGKMTDELTGYDEETPQAVGHDEAGCLKWVGVPLEVITGFEETSTGIEFKKASVIVLAAEPEESAGTVEFSDVDVVTSVGLKSSGDALEMGRTTVRVLATASASNTELALTQITAIEDISLGGTGLVADRKYFRAFSLTDAPDTTIETHECPAPAPPPE